MMMDQKSKTHRKLKIVVIGIILILVSAALVPSFMKKLDAFEEITEKGYSEQVHTTDIQKNHQKIIDKTNEWLKTADLEKWHQTSADGYRLVAAYFPSDGSSDH